MADFVYSSGLYDEIDSRSKLWYVDFRIGTEGRWVLICEMQWSKWIESTPFMICYPTSSIENSALKSDFATCFSP